MASFSPNSSVYSICTSDDSDYDDRRGQQEYGEPMLYNQQNGPYWIRPSQEHEEAATCHEFFAPMQGNGPRLASEINKKMPKSDHSSINEILEGMEPSGKVLDEHNTSHTVERDISFNQQNPSQACYDEELEGLRASAEAAIQKFQQEVTELNNRIREDLASLNSVLTGENTPGIAAAQHEIEAGIGELYPRAAPEAEGEEYGPGIARAQHEIEAGIGELYPRAAPKSEGEEYAPGISYDMYLRLRTRVCGKVTPSELAPGQPPIRLPIRTKEIRKWECPVCGQRRVRLWHVEGHFPRCVEINGNPNGLHWFDHPTILKHYEEGKRLHRKRIGTE